MEKDKFDFEQPELSESDKEYAKRIGLTPEQIHQKRLKIALYYAEKGYVDRSVDPLDIGLPSIYVDKLKEKGYDIATNPYDKPLKYDISKMKEVLDVQFSEKYVETLQDETFTSIAGDEVRITRLLLAPELANYLNFNLMTEDNYHSFITRCIAEGKDPTYYCQRFNSLGKSRGSSYIPSVVVEEVSKYFDILSPVQKHVK